MAAGAVLTCLPSHRPARFLQSCVPVSHENTVATERCTLTTDRTGQVMQRYLCFCNPHGSEILWNSLPYSITMLQLTWELKILFLCRVDKWSVLDWMYAGRERKKEREFTGEMWALSLDAVTLTGTSFVSESQLVFTNCLHTYCAKCAHSQRIDFLAWNPKRFLKESKNTVNCCIFGRLISKHFKL